MTLPEALEVEHAKAYYDPETRIAHIVYDGVLDSDATLQVYEWLDLLYKAIGVEAIYGQIFDFRKVEEFEDDNLKTARRTSNRMNMRIDTSMFPVALLVSDHYHEQILQGSMRISPEHKRKQIVWSEDEAVKFIHEWQAERAKEE